MYSLYKEVIGLEGESLIEWFYEKILTYYENVEVYDYTNISIYFKIPKFSNKVIHFYYQNSNLTVSGKTICAEFGDTFSKNGNTITLSNKKTLFTNYIDNCITATRSEYCLLTQQGIIIITCPLKPLMYGILKGSNNKYYFICATANSWSGNGRDAYSYDLETGDKVSINPLGSPSASSGFNNENYNLELHKVTLLNSNSRPLLDDNNLNVVLSNFYATIAKFLDNGIGLYFYKRGFLTPNLGYQYSKSWTSRSFFFLDEVEGALIETDEEDTEPVIPE